MLHGVHSEYPPPPTPPTLPAHRHGGPPARTPPQRGGSPGRSSQPTSTQPCADRAGSEPRRPQAPSHLPYHSIPPPCLHSRGLVSGAERGCTQGSRRAALVLVAVVLRHSRSANAGDRAGRGQAPLAAPRPLAPSLAWRRAGKLRERRRAGSAPQEGKEREGPANAAAVAAESARSAFPASVPRGPAPAASWRERTAARGPCREPTTPSMQPAGGASGRRGAHALPGALREAWSTGPVVHAGMEGPT